MSWNNGCCGCQARYQASWYPTISKQLWHHWGIVLIVVVTLVIPSYPTQAQRPEKIPIGAIFDKEFLGIRGAFYHAVNEYNQEDLQREIMAYEDIINTADAFKISKLICKQFSHPVFAMVGSVQPDSFDTLHSYANTFQMPFVTPWFPENVPNPSSGLTDYATGMLPDYHQAIIDLIHYYKWDHIIYLYDSHDGLLRLQKIFQSQRSANPTFEVRLVQRVDDAAHALDVLRSIESDNRWSVKYVVLDCKTKTAKELIIAHVRDVHMGRRNYHYLMSGLVMDEHWEEDVVEYGALNITGFRIVDTSQPYVKHFLNKWRSLDPKIFPGAGTDFISAQSALIYDAMKLVFEALKRLQRKKHDVFSGVMSGHVPIVSCDTHQAEQSTWEYGERLTRLIRKVDIEGLTGNISFTDQGKRVGCSLDVVEMTYNSETVKIGTWTDTHGFISVAVKYTRLPAEVQQAKSVYRVTTIMEKPFIMERGDSALYMGNERYEGYAKDLADLISHKIGFNYTLHIVRDGSYGAMDGTPEGWDGMVGELIRNEADIAIAPLTITSSRERVIDFTKPFMTLGISIMIKKPVKQKPGVFSFMSPLSQEIWMCVVFAYLGVSIVLFIVSRFSPYEWKVADGYNNSNMVNHFTISNSLWFALGAFMHQGIDFSPRSLSGRIVGSVWWFFTLILISSYTANLAAFLTVDRMVTDIKSVDQLARQTEVEYGTRDGGSTKEFFEKSKISVYSRMWEFMTSRKHVFTRTYEEGIERVRSSKGKYAYLLESVKNEYINEQFPCDTMKIGQNLNSNGYGVATPMGSPLKERLNLAILQLKENGDLARIKNKWWFDRSSCDREQSETQTNALSLSNVAGIFYILTGGLVLAMVVAFCEFCYKSKRDATRTKLSLSDAMKAKARMSITGSKETMDNGTVSTFYGPASQTLDGEPIHSNTHTQV
ncbi:unnamed protein product, partial [Meganyctiphanes norvegica]